MLHRIVKRRCLRQPREERSLRQGQRARARGVERLRARLRAVRVLAVEHLVQVRGENLRLRPDACELVREARLLDFARDRAIGVADVEVANELLRDRRAALHDAAGRRVLEVERARSPGSRARRAARTARPRSRPSPSAATATSGRVATAAGSSSRRRRRASCRRRRRGTSSSRGTPGAAS